MYPPTGSEALTVVQFKFFVAVEASNISFALVFKMEVLVEVHLHFKTPQISSTDVVPRFCKILITLLPLFHQSMEYISIEITAQAIALTAGDHDIFVVTATTI